MIQLSAPGGVPCRGGGLLWLSSFADGCGGSGNDGRGREIGKKEIGDWWLGNGRGRRLRGMWRSVWRRSAWRWRVQVLVVMLDGALMCRQRGAGFGRVTRCA